MAEQTEQNVYEHGVPQKETSLESHPQEKALTSDFPEGGRAGWLAACGAAGTLFCTFGFANAFGIFQAYYETHQLSDKSASQISWIGSTQVFSLFAVGVFGGPLFDRFGAVIMWPAAVAFLFSVFMTSLCTQYYQFVLAQGILGGVCMGMTMSPAMAAVSQYFHQKRGAALGLAVAGSSIGGVVFPIALDKMLNSSLGFGWTIRIIGFIMIACLLPSVLAIRARLPPRKKSLLLPSAFREVAYVSLLGAIFVMMLGVFIPIFYLPAYAVEHGMGEQLAFYLTAILNGASFFGRVIPGITADKYVGRFNMLGLAAVATGILCFCWQATDSNASIIAFAALYGFASGAIVSMFSACLAQVPKDPRNIGTYMGMGMSVISIAALIGPPINGALFNHYHDYKQVSVFSGVVTLVGGLAMIPVKMTNGKRWSEKW